MSNEINEIAEKLLKEMYNNSILKPFDSNLFSLFKAYNKKDVKHTINSLIIEGYIHTYYNIKYQDNDFFYNEVFKN